LDFPRIREVKRRKTNLSLFLPLFSPFCTNSDKILPLILSGRSTFYLAHCLFLRYAAEKSASRQRNTEYSNCVERAAANSKPASSQEDEGEDDEETRVTNPRAGPSTRPPQPRKKKQLGFDSRKLDEIPPEYLPSAWLAEYVPKKSPYFPQMGDEVMFTFVFLRKKKFVFMKCLTLMNSQIFFWCNVFEFFHSLCNFYIDRVR
jgi:hypothetical protein